MRILLMANHFNTGGVTSYLMNLSQGLRRAGHDVWVVSAGGNCAALLRLRGVDHIDLDIRIKAEVHPKVWLALPELVSLIKEKKIDIIHANTRVTQVLASMASSMTRVPFVSTCHGFFKPHLLRRLFPCWGSQTIAISQGVYRHLNDDFNVSVDKIVLIANGIDVDQYMPLSEDERMRLRRQWGVEGGPILGLIARLSDVKGIDILIKAMPQVLERFQEARLWIVGEGPESSRLKDLVEAKGLGARIKFEPVVNRTADILPIFDLFVMPSLQEGLGLSVIEAQAAGVPVVASNVGGLPDLIEEGKTGGLVPSGDSKALAEKIIDMLSSPERSKGMAAAARELVLERFSLDKMTRATIGVYEQNIGR